MIVDVSNTILFIHMNSMIWFMKFSILNLMTYNNHILLLLTFIVNKFTWAAIANKNVIFVVNSHFQYLIVSSKLNQSQTSRKSTEFLTHLAFF